MMALADPPRGFEPFAQEPVPGVAPGSPGKDGRLELEFSLDGAGKTQLTRSFARAPFHVSGTIDRDPHPSATSVVVQSPTGGVGQGDRRRVSISVGADAMAHVTTGSASKVQSMEANYARSATSLSVGPGGHLEYVPRATILHADARYARDLSLEIAETGSAILGEIVVAGRLARGERFAFDRYDARVQAHLQHGGDRQSGPPLFSDTTRLDPDAGETHPSAPGILDANSVVGSLFVVTPGGPTESLSEALHAAATDDAADRSSTRSGATALPNDAGVLVRAVGERADGVRSALHAAWNRARQARFDVAAPRWSV